MKTYVGIDPGKDGAICYIQENGSIEHGSIAVPKIGKDYDLKEIVNQLQGLNITHAVLEKNNGHAAKGRQSAFIMGEGSMLWKMALVALGIPFTLVPPQTWQKEMWKGITPQYIASAVNKSGKKKDTKSMSMMAAKNLFPNFDFRKTPRSKKRS